MPVYQYRGAQGELIELVRTIAERDQAPAGFARVTVPCRIGLTGLGAARLDPAQPEAAVPRAFRQLEDTLSHREILANSGYTADEVKQIWAREDD